MAHIEGVPLAEHLQRQGRYDDVAQAVALTRQVLDGLAWPPSAPSGPPPRRATGGACPSSPRRSSPCGSRPGPDGLIPLGVTAPSHPRAGKTARRTRKKSLAQIVLSPCERHFGW